jgi:hypothetical protein
MCALCHERLWSDAIRLPGGRLAHSGCYLQWNDDKYTALIRDICAFLAAAIIVTVIGGVSTGLVVVLLGLFLFGLCRHAWRII